MSTLENQFKPLFVALYDENSSKFLTAEQCLIIAKWAFKTAVTSNYSANYKKIIPLDQIHSFYQDNDLPSNLKADLAFCAQVGLRKLIGGNKLAIIPNTYKNQKELINKSYIATFQFDHLLIRISWTPDAKIQIRNIDSSTVYRVYPQEKERILIQYVKDKVFKDIAQFHFFSSIIVEDSVVVPPQDFNKMIQNLQTFRSKHSF
jgi:hypothetical protein